jgi:hypothetical protein
VPPDERTGRSIHWRSSGFDPILPAMRLVVSLYGWVAREALVKAAKAWPIALATVAYALIFELISRLVAPLGLAGGFLLGFLEAGCIASYLYLLSRAVQGSKLRFEDLKDSFGAFFWDVVGVLFVLWIAGFIVQFVTQMAGDHGEFVAAAYGLAVAVFLNPVPEIIYLGRGRGRTTELLLDSARFVQSHWVEWFLPNVLFGVALLALALGREAFNFETLTVTLPGLFSLQSAYRVGNTLVRFGDLWAWPLILALVHYAMVFRGLLFREISGGNWRVRAFRSRTR